VPKAKLEPNGSDILNIEGAASQMGVGKGVVYRLAKDGIIPGARVGDVWRFSKSGLEQWIREEGLKNIK